MLEESFANAKEEADDRTRKLKKLMRKYREAQAEMRDLQDEFEQEREG